MVDGHLRSQSGFKPVQSTTSLLDKHRQPGTEAPANNIQPHSHRRFVCMKAVNFSEPGWMELTERDNDEEEVPRIF
jgi:hypothetical protein